MQSQSINAKDMSHNERLTKIAELLAQAIYRLKQREAIDREKGLYEPVSVVKHQTQRD